MDDAALARLLEREIPGLVAAYRYGSSVNGEDRPDGDVDLAFLAREALPAARRWDLEGHLASLLKRSVDLLDLQRASTVLRMHVISTGVTVVVRNERERGLFEDLTFSLYSLSSDLTKRIPSS